MFMLAFEAGSQTPDRRPTAANWGETIHRELVSRNISNTPSSLNTEPTPSSITNTTKSLSVSTTLPRSIQRPKPTVVIKSQTTAPRKDDTKVLAIGIIVATLIFLAVRFIPNDSTTKFQVKPLPIVDTSANTDSKSIGRIFVYGLRCQNHPDARRVATA